MKWLFAAFLFLLPAALCAETDDGFFDPHTAHDMVEQGTAVLLDVREESEIAAGMAQGAVWLATSKIDAEAPEFHAFIASLDLNKTVIVYCASGKRAAKAIAKLAELGIPAVNMGTFARWQEAGLPIVMPK